MTKLAFELCIEVVGNFVIFQMVFVSLHLDTYNSSYGPNTETVSMFID
jgi:hypothetical protein